MLQDKYKVYNLCAERLYDASLFEGKVCFHFLFFPVHFPYFHFYVAPNLVNIEPTFVLLECYSEDYYNFYEEDENYIFFVEDDFFFFLRKMRIIN